MKTKAEVEQAIRDLTRRRSILPMLDPMQTTLAAYIVVLRWVLDQEKRGDNVQWYLEGIRDDFEVRDAEMTGST